MQVSGNLKKMSTQLAEPVNYALRLGEESVLMNDLIGKEIGIKFEGRINCMACGNLTKKAFGQGFCFPCFSNAPEMSPCIIRPELCEAHLGKGRDVAWEEKHHLQSHFVYLAIASGLKVGVTRGDQIPTRWIDQGAWKGIRLAKTPNRFEAGKIEVALKEHLADKTHWQKMLKNVLADHIDILEEKKRLRGLLPEGSEDFYSVDNQVIEINYPVLAFPEKVKSINLEKTPDINYKLNGIKGQYLIFDGGLVINLRKYSGFFIELSY